MAIVVIVQASAEGNCKPWAAQLRPEGFSSEPAWLSFLHPQGVLAGVRRACAQWGWHVPPAAKHTGPGERVGSNGEGGEPGEGAEPPGKLAKRPRAEWAPSAPDNSSDILLASSTRGVDTEQHKTPSSGRRQDFINVRLSNSV